MYNKQVLCSHMVELGDMKNKNFLFKLVKFKMYNIVHLK